MEAGTTCQGRDDGAASSAAAAAAAAAAARAHTHLDASGWDAAGLEPVSEQPAQEKRRETETEREDM